MSAITGMTTLAEAKPADPTMMSADLDKSRKAYELRLKGVPIANIAKSFKVTDSTIYRWLKEYREEFSREFTDRPRTDLLVDMLAFYRVVRDTAMKEAHQIDLDGMKVRADGSIDASGNIDRNAKHKMLTLAMNAETNSFNVLAKTGVLPSVAKEIHVSVADTRPELQADEEDTTLTKEQLMERIVKLVGTQSELPPLDMDEEQQNVDNFNRSADSARLDDGTGSKAQGETTGNSQRAD